MARILKLRRPRNHGRPAYDENGNGEVTVTDDAATAILQGAGLSIKRVTRSPSGQLTAQWRKEPTDADVLLAQTLVEGVAHAF